MGGRLLGKLFSLNHNGSPNFINKDTDYTKKIMQKVKEYKSCL